MVTGQGEEGEGGNEADDDSLRKMKTNKHQQLSNKLDCRLIKSAETTENVSQLLCRTMFPSMLVVLATSLLGKKQQHKKHFLLHRNFLNYKSNL